LLRSQTLPADYQQFYGKKPDFFERVSSLAAGDRMLASDRRSEAMRVLWEWLAVSPSPSAHRWLFRYQPFLHVCGEAKLRRASDGFASHQAGRQLLCLCQSLRCPGSPIVTIEMIGR